MSPYNSGDMSIRRSRRLAGLAPEPFAVPYSSAVPDKNPPDAPETEVTMELIIRVPVRRFPPANAEEKRLACEFTRYYLNLIEKTPTRTMRIYYSAQLFYEIARQPILVAQHKKFRDTVITKMAELENELYNGARTEYTDDMHDALHEMDLVLGDITKHPWYTE